MRAVRYLPITDEWRAHDFWVKWKAILHLPAVPSCSLSAAAFSPRVLPAFLTRWASAGMGDKLQPLIFSVCPCEEGSTSNGQKCVSCTEGKFKDSVGRGPCTDCPDNSTSPPGASDARDCVCNIGFTAGPENVTCLPCEHGTYKNTIGSNECTRCRAHNQNMLNEMTMDDDCKCRVGFTGPDGGPCTKCPAGTYKDHSGSSACKLCPANSSSVPGSYSAEHCLCESGYTLNGNSGCTMCLPGFTRDKNDLCVTCDAGKFKSGVGDDACTACPPYSHSAAGSPSEQACLCFVGSQSDGSGSCELCPAGRFKTEEVCPGASGLVGLVFRIFWESRHPILYDI